MRHASARSGEQKLRELEGGRKSLRKPRVFRKNQFAKNHGSDDLYLEPLRIQIKFLPGTVTVHVYRLRAHGKRKAEIFFLLQCRGLGVVSTHVKGNGLKARRLRGRSIKLFPVVKRFLELFSNAALAINICSFAEPITIIESTLHALSTGVLSWCGRLRTHAPARFSLCSHWTDCCEWPNLRHSTDTFRFR